MADFQSDAFVFFGATGDLAHKQIFPSLQGLCCERLSRKPACLIFAGELGADADALVLVMPTIRASLPTT